MYQDELYDHHHRPNMKCQPKAEPFRTVLQLHLTICQLVCKIDFNILRTSVKSISQTDLGHERLGPGINDYVLLYLFCEICTVTV
jgi:hypothetical protein